MMQNVSRQQLNEIATAAKVSRFLHYREFLALVYERLKTELDSYSYLAFADDLGFSKTNVMRLIIAGKRPLTSKAATRIADAMNLRSYDRRYWDTLVKYNISRSAAEREKLFKQLMELKSKSLPSELGQTQLRYFAEWFYPVIREMTALEDFQFDPEWIQKRLGFPLRLEQIKQALDLLQELGMIKVVGPSKRVQRTANSIKTDAEVESMAIINYHQQMIDAGRESITRVDELKRTVNAVTVCINEESLPLIKGKIEELQNWLLELEKKVDKAEQVYQLNVQLFPFTKSRGVR